MEKKDNFLIGLAKICDSIENLGYDLKSPTLVFELSKVEFEKIYDLIRKMYGGQTETPKNTFTIKIGNVDILFNTNSDD